LNLTPYFRVWSEQEWGGGFVDFYLAPFIVFRNQPGPFTKGSGDALPKAFVE